MHRFDTNIFFDNHAQYYAEYDFKTLLDRANFILSSIEVVKENYFVEDGSYDFLVAKVVVVDRSSGHILYPKIYPRYFTNDNNSGSFLGRCDNMSIRFSVLFDKSGFFTPLWTELFKDGRKYKPEGPRMDWDKYNGVVPPMTYQRYSLLKTEAENSTATQNDDLVLRLLPRWLDFASINQEED